jgi:RNA polymerase sigma-70 factor (ECF subfamily)
MHQRSFTTFETIYKQFYRKAFYFTKSYVHDEMIAEDITSEALLKLWEQVRRGGVKHPEAFLLTLLKNKSLDHLKHEAIKTDAFHEIKNTTSVH